MSEEKREEREERTAVKEEIDSSETSGKVQSTDEDEGINSGTRLEELAMQNMPERRKEFIRAQKEEALIMTQGILWDIGFGEEGWIEKVIGGVGFMFRCAGKENR